MSEKHQAASMPSEDPRSLGQLFAAVTQQMSGLVRGEIELAQVNLKEKVTKIGAGGVLLAVAGVLALYMLGMLLLSAAWALSNVMPMWAAFLVVAGVLLGLILILAVFGLALLKRSQNDKVAPQQGLKKSVDAVKMGIKK